MDSVGDDAACESAVGCGQRPRARNAFVLSREDMHELSMRFNVNVNVNDWKRDDSRLVCRRASSRHVPVVDVSIKRYLELHFSDEGLPRRFELRAFLNSGTYAAAFDIRDVLLREALCLRLPHKTMSQKQAIRERRGYEILSRLQTNRHPAILELRQWGLYQFESGRQEFQRRCQGGPAPLQRGIFAVVGLCRGGDMFDYEVSHSEVALNLAVDCTIPLVGALKAVSDAGYLHCDLKPENICFKDTVRRPVIIDFGMACPDATVVRHGTPEYYSPEQFGNTRLLHQTQCSSTMDLYSLGLTMLEFIAPKSGGELTSLYHVGLQPPSQRVSSINAIFGMPQYADNPFLLILRAMLRSSPSLRPPHSALLEQLQTLATNLRRTSQPSPSAGGRRR